MKKIISIIGFASMLLLALAMLYGGGYVSMFLFLVLAFLISPFSATIKERFLDSPKKKGLGWVAGAVIFCTAIGFVPTSGDSKASEESTAPTTEVTESVEEVEDRSIPIVEETNDKENVADQIDTEKVADEASEESAAYTIDLSETTTDETQSTEERSVDISQETEVSDESVVTQAAEVGAAAAIASGVSNSSTDTEEDQTYNFDLYDNPENQQTADTWVLNTNSKKIHYPSCDAVATMAEKNYATSSLPLEDLLAQGYTRCKRCFK